MHSVLPRCSDSLLQIANLNKVFKIFFLQFVLFVKTVFCYPIISILLIYFCSLGQNLSPYHAYSKQIVVGAEFPLRNTLSYSS